MVSQIWSSTSVKPPSDWTTAVVVDCSKNWPNWAGWRKNIVRFLRFCSFWAEFAAYLVILMGQPLKFYEYQNTYFAFPAIKNFKKVQHPHDHFLNPPLSSHTLAGLALLNLCGYKILGSNGFFKFLRVLITHLTTNNIIVLPKLIDSCSPRVHAQPQEFNISKLELNQAYGCNLQSW